MIKQQVAREVERQRSVRGELICGETFYDCFPVSLKSPPAKPADKRLVLRVVSFACIFLVYTQFICLAYLITIAQLRAGFIFLIVCSFTLTYLVLQVNFDSSKKPPKCPKFSEKLRRSELAPWACWIISDFNLWKYYAAIHIQFFVYFRSLVFAHNFRNVVWLLACACEGEKKLIEGGWRGSFGWILIWRGIIMQKQKSSPVIHDKRQNCPLFSCRAERCGFAPLVRYSNEIQCRARYRRKAMKPSAAISNYIDVLMYAELHNFWLESGVVFHFALELLLPN